MNLQLTRDDRDHLIVELREGDTATTLEVSPARPGVDSLSRALGCAVELGYGECFWPAVIGGQYWWIFSRRDTSLEVVVMWTRGGATGWEHVFRATDSTDWVVDRVRDEIARLGVV